MTDLLESARNVLSQLSTLHCMSVRIGQLERISDSGALDAEIKAARGIIEQADLICAEIDKRAQGEREWGSRIAKTRQQINKPTAKGR